MVVLAMAFLAENRRFNQTGSFIELPKLFPNTFFQSMSASGGVFFCYGENNFEDGGFAGIVL